MPDDSALDDRPDRNPFLRWRLSRQVTLGNAITVAVLIVGLIAGYASLGATVRADHDEIAAVKVSNLAQTEKVTAATEGLLITIHSLELSINTVQAQMAEREKRFDAAQSLQNIWMEQHGMFRK